MWTVNFQMFKLDLEKAEEPEIKFPSVGSQPEESHPWQGHAEGSLTKCKDVFGLQGFPLEIPEHPPPETRVCLLYCVMLSTYSSVINRGLSPHHLFLEKLELLDNKSPGHKVSVSIQKPLWWLSSACRTRTAAHVIFWGLLTAGGTGSLKYPRNVGASKESKSLE